MHIHKINTTSKEHQNFLAQNRKDPITGDSILEGDEVVFCAGCKSVFLKDTWEYLGKQHCNQTNTLKNFPFIPSNLDLVTKEDIFFYTYLPTDDNSASYIPTLDHSIWKIKKRELSEYHYFFNSTPIYILGFLFFALGGVLAYTIQSYVPLIGSFLLIFLTIISSHFHNSENAKKIKTVHKEFKNNVFFLSNMGIGFSSQYGIKEYVLPAHKIKSLEFSFSTSFFSSSYCTIHYFEEGKTKFQIVNFFKEELDTAFLNAIDDFTTKFSIPVDLKINSNPRYKSAVEFVNATRSKIRISIQ